MFAKIINGMEVKAGKIKDKIDVQWIKRGDCNPKDSPNEAAFKRAMGQLDVAHRKNRILAGEVKVLLDKFENRWLSINEIDSQGRGQRFKEKELQ